MLIICFFSFYDDIKNLSSAKKLIFQIVIVFLGISLFDKQLSIFLSRNFQIGEIYLNQNIMKIILYIFLSMLWMWVMNVFNFMDGIDGITAVQVLFFSVGIIILSLMGTIDRQYSYIGILLFSVFLGFLYWNISPSKKSSLVIVAQYQLVFLLDQLLFLVLLMKRGLFQFVYWLFII